MLLSIKYFFIAAYFMVAWFFPPRDWPTSTKTWWTSSLHHCYTVPSPSQFQTHMPSLYEIPIIGSHHKAHSCDIPFPYQILEKSASGTLGVLSADSSSNMRTTSNVCASRRRQTSSPLAVTRLKVRARLAVDDFTTRTATWLNRGVWNSLRGVIVPFLQHLIWQPHKLSS